MWFKVVTAFLVMAVVVGSLAGYDQIRRRDADAALVPPAEAMPVLVTTEVARMEEMPRRIEAVGTIVADRQVLLAAEVAGRVTGIHFASGQVVSSGETLVQLNDLPLRREVDRHRVAERLAEINLDRARQLTDVAVTRSRVDELAATLDDARAATASTEEEMAQRAIRAPFDGTLGIRGVDLGQYVEAGHPIATLTDTTRLHVDFTVPERYRAEISLRQEVLVSVDARPGEIFLGAVTAIDPQIDPGTRAVQVRATLNSAEGQLWPGKFAHVHLVLPPIPATLTVAARALEISVGGDAVYVVRARDGEHRAERVPVRIGVRRDDRVTIADGAISAGDQVVVAGQINLQDGARVGLQNENAAMVPPSLEPRGDQE